MKTLNFRILLVLLIIFLNSCTSTQIVSSWRAPGKQLHAGEWTKVLVLAMLRNETDRRRTEDEMVKYLDGKGIASYSYLDENFNRSDEQALRNKLKNDGFDAAVTMRLVDVDKERIFVPAQHYNYPLYYDNFGRYYYRNWPFYTTPGYYSVTTKFIIETVIYSIPDDKIIWSGITETYDPAGVVRLTDEIAGAIRQKMLQEGFIEK
ncbi:hypothetical protein [Chryseobacterium sp.]|uniref:hypothetical protein n=1 Tax=Chryseobacterium sp. TaxID=1871047 RepID=UPI0011C8D1BA|nr:hypothetical protein [Chryseobacterium sp.]TXF79016.1 hypothetical protein FUA25_01075 [Chryseobacterium sp.]